jgi:hypothetical protein
MGVILQRQCISGRLNVWELDGSEWMVFEKTGFPAEEKERILLIRDTLKRQQKIAVRMLLDHMLPGSLIGYDSFSKPYLPGSAYGISISHSGNKVAVMVGESTDPGVDIERIDPKIERIAHKFMSAEELLRLTPAHRTEELYVHWAAKEALYKVYGKKQLHFNRDIIISPFAYEAHRGGSLLGRVNEGGQWKCYELCYEKTGAYMLVYKSNWVSC